MGSADEVGLAPDRDRRRGAEQEVVAADQAAGPAVSTGNLKIPADPPWGLDKTGNLWYN